MRDLTGGDYLSILIVDRRDSYRQRKGGTVLPHPDSLKPGNPLTPNDRGNDCVFFGLKLVWNESAD